MPQARNNPGEYIEALDPKGYISNGEITGLDGQWLVRGSQDVLIKKNRNNKVASVVTRLGYTRLGAARTNQEGTTGSIDWETNTQLKRSVRGFGNALEVWYEDAWITIKDDFTRKYFQMFPWWDANELIDILLIVNKTDEVFDWSGGIAKIASVTTNTLTKKGYLSGTTIAFVEGGASPDTITDSANGFVTAGFKAGDRIIIEGSDSNDGVYTIASVVAGTITLSGADDLNAESAGATVVVKRDGSGTWAEERFTIQQTLVTGTTYSFSNANPDKIADSANGFVSAGFKAGDTIVVRGSTDNDGMYTVTAVTAGELTLSSKDELTTEAAGDTVTIHTQKSVTIDGVEYHYEGGEDTGTLTGVSPDPSAGGVVADDIAIQTVKRHRPLALANFQLDLVSVLNNNAYFGSLRSREVYVSKVTDFRDFAKSTPRIPGEGFTLTLDSAPTGFAPDEDRMYIPGRKDDWYRVSINLSADQSTEAIVIDKLKTASGQAAVGQGAIINIKNAVAFLSFEPTVDTLGRIEDVDTTQAVPISDPIKDDLRAYDITDAHGIFWRGEIWITLPQEGKVIIYDVENTLWHAPQNLGIGRFAIIEVNGKDRLCGHSPAGNETYLLEDGFNDLGAPFKAVAAFGYENYGTRFWEKNFDELATEIYMTQSTKVSVQVLYDYEGSGEIREFEIDGSDETIAFTPVTNAGLGTSPYGSQPHGSSAEELPALSKYRVIHTTTPLDFFERQRIFISESIDARFEIIAMGENAELSDNIPSFIKK